MSRMSSSVSLLLVVILAVSSLIMVESANAQSIPKPAIPEFSLRFVNVSYSVIDQYTGQSGQVDNSTIELTIKNQPFTTINDKVDATNTSLYYNIQVKGHYTNDWTEVYNSHNGSYPPYIANYVWYDYPIQSNSEYTTLSLSANYPANSKVDFRVQAIIANVTDLLLPNFLPDGGLRYHSDADYHHQLAWTAMSLSDWSPPQTLTIADGSTSSSISNSPYPTILHTSKSIRIAYCSRISYNRNLAFVCSYHLDSFNVFTKEQ